MSHEIPVAKPGGAVFYLLFYHSFSQSISQQCSCLEYAVLHTIQYQPAAPKSTSHPRPISRIIPATFLAITSLCPINKLATKSQPHTSYQEKLTQTESMRQPLLTNQHLRSYCSLALAIAMLTPPHRNNLIPRLLRNPMVIPTKVEKQRGERLPRMRNAPDIIRPFVGCNRAHFVGGHVSAASS